MKTCQRIILLGMAVGALSGCVVTTSQTQYRQGYYPAPVTYYNYPRGYYYPNTYYQYNRTGYNRGYYDNRGYYYSNSYPTSQIQYRTNTQYYYQGSGMRR